MLAESWYSAEEAVAAGLADSVASSEAQPAASFDLSSFKFAGRAEAPGPMTPVASGRRSSSATRATDLHAKRFIPLPQ